MTHAFSTPESFLTRGPFTDAHHSPLHRQGRGPDERPVRLSCQNPVTRCGQSVNAKAPQDDERQSLT